jgi:hypothetical protein
MVEVERRREERRVRTVDPPAGSGGTGGTVQADNYFAAVDQLISNTVSENPEIMIREGEQENGE